tara:strand:- start:107167 stop:107910 length:744 start_codon:yes stop_codon:yes gene_type:complete
MRYLISISFLWLTCITIAQNQDIKLGVSGSTQVIQNTKFLDAEYQPENASFTYLETSEGAGIINRSHIFNAYSLGFVANYTFKKSTISIEPQYFMQRSVYRFELESYSERTVGMKAFRLPIFYSYKLFRKKNSMFLTVGTVFTAAKNYDFQHPGTEYLFEDGEIYNGGVDHGNDHFRSILYSNDPYWQHFFGIGKNIGDLKITFRFMARAKGSAEKIAADIGQLELNLSYHIVSLSDFQKKRKIYHE